MATFLKARSTLFRFIGFSFTRGFEEAFVLRWVVRFLV